MIRILLVDDQKSIREVLRVMLDLDSEMKVVGTASDGFTAIEQAEILQPDLVLIDIEMPTLNGFDATKAICQKVPGIKVLILSMHKSDEYVSKSLDAGAAGYLLKNTPAHELRESIRFIFKEDHAFSPQDIEEWWESETIHAPSNGQTVKPHPIPFNIPLTPPSPALESRAPHTRLNASDPYPGIAGQSIPAQIVGAAASETNKTNHHSLLYGGIGIVGVLSIWGLSLFYLSTAIPSYTSQWTITLPSSGSSANVNLPGIGQATSENESPYNNQASDPRENFKTLALTTEVLDLAAQQSGIPSSEFGEPKVQVVLNTTLMNFEISGKTPQEAQKKAFALHHALESRLNQLRQQETAQKDQGLKGSLRDAEQKLAIAHQKLTEFQTRTGLDSSEQLRDLSINTEQLRRQQSEVNAQLEDTSARFRRQSLSLGLSVEEVSDAFLLDSDTLFQQYVSDYSLASAAVEQQSQLSANHPTVLDKVDALNQARKALLSHAQLILGRPTTLATLRKLSLRNGSDSSTNREKLFQDLLSLRTQEQGLRQQSEELKRQVIQLEEKLKTLSKQNGTLVKLERDAKIAEAIFSSTVTRQDLSQSTVSASYPPIAIFSQPNLPEESNAPNVKYVLLGASLSSLFMIIGAIALWLRNRQNSKLGTIPPNPALSPVSTLAKRD